jgi:hypothetical protein
MSLQDHMSVKPEDLALIRKRLSDFIDAAEEIQPPSAYDQLVNLLIDLDKVIARSKKQT